MRGEWKELARIVSISKTNPWDKVLLCQKFKDEEISFEKAMDELIRLGNSAREAWNYLQRSKEQ